VLIQFVQLKIFYHFVTMILIIDYQMFLNVYRYFIQFKVTAFIVVIILFYLSVIFHLNFNAYAFFFNQLCDTYPRYLYVPSSATTTVLLGSSRFRSKGRLPVLSYLHRNKVMFKTNALNCFLNRTIYNLYGMHPVVCYSQKDII
jgi:hypothetical protein